MHLIKSVDEVELELNMTFNSRVETGELWAPQVFDCGNMIDGELSLVGVFAWDQTVWLNLS